MVLLMTRYIFEPNTHRAAVISFYVAVIMLGVEGLRFFLTYFFKDVLKNELITFIIPWRVAVLVLACLIDGFSRNAER